MIFSRSSTLRISFSLWYKSDSRFSLGRRSHSFRCKARSNVVEERIRDITPSSSEITFPTEPHQHAQRSRLPTLKVTFNNIESAIKTPANSAQHSIQKSKQHPERKLKSPTFTAKNFFRTHTNPTLLSIQQTLYPAHASPFNEAESIRSQAPNAAFADEACTFRTGWLTSATRTKQRHAENVPKNKQKPTITTKTQNRTRNPTSFFATPFNENTKHRGKLTRE